MLSQVSHQFGDRDDDVERESEVLDRGDRECHWLWIRLPLFNCRGLWNSQFQGRKSPEGLIKKVQHTIEFGIEYDVSLDCKSTYVVKRPVNSILYFLKHSVSSPLVLHRNSGKVDREAKKGNTQHLIPHCREHARVSILDIASIPSFLHTPTLSVYPPHTVVNWQRILTGECSRNKDTRHYRFVERCGQTRGITRELCFVFKGFCACEMQFWRLIFLLDSPGNVCLIASVRISKLLILSFVSCLSL